MVVNRFGAFFFCLWVYAYKDYLTDMFNALAGDHVVLLNDTVNPYNVSGGCCCVSPWTAGKNLTENDRVLIAEDIGGPFISS